jgi:sRNA-binding carbon storage regulator CsrA
MLVLSRQEGESLVVGSADETCIITVLKFLPQERAVATLIARAWTAEPGQLDGSNVIFSMDVPFKVSDAIEVMLVDLRGDKARFGINAPLEGFVHRLEVHQAIRQDWRTKLHNRGSDPEDGPAGSRVPRPPTPKPPSLDVRLDEPRPEEPEGS